MEAIKFKWRSVFHADRRPLCPTGSLRVNIRHVSAFHPKDLLQFAIKVTQLTN